LKELGESFKEKREEIGITSSEVANDLGIDQIVIENLEEGNAKVFKDVLELKEVVLQLTKYLGLDEKYVLGELNDYLFEKTSKISIEDIKAQLEKTKGTEEKKKVSSPYTIEEKDHSNRFVVIAMVLLTLVVVIIFYFVLKEIYLG